MLYFGVWNASKLGHHLYDRNGYFAHGLPLPFLEHTLDGQYCPVDPEEREGRARVTHIGGWTILAFWDRSGDQPDNSNSAVVEKGEWTFGQMVDFFRSGV